MLAKSLWLVPMTLLLAAQPDQDAGKKELKRLQGAWVMVGLEIDGKDVPANKIAQTTLTIKGDRYCTKVKKTEHECTIRLDPTKKPAAIDMIFTKPGSARRRARASTSSRTTHCGSPAASTPSRSDPINS